MAVTVLDTDAYMVDSTNTLLLPGPATNEVKHYTVTLGAPSTPSVTPTLTGLTYSMRWPTTTPWASASFVLVIHGDQDVPTLEWRWGVEEDPIVAAVVETTLSFGSWVLNASDIGSDSNYSPAGVTGCDLSIRSLANLFSGDGSVAGFPSFTPIGSLGVGTVPVEAFYTTNPTASASMVVTTVPDEDDALTWSINGLFGPHFGWGATCSFFESAPGGGDEDGWRVGRLAGT